MLVENQNKRKQIMFDFIHHIQRKPQKIIYLVLFLITFSIVYTSTLNPFLSRIMNVDTSVYISITQGLTRGHALYKDIADNKGPFLYFLSVPGFFLGGTTGVWITELIIIFISFLFMYKTALLFTNIKTALLTVFFTSLATHPFYYVNAGTEEYALPFLAVSFYIFTKHYISTKKTNFFEINILGISFACSIMLRLNMFPLWAGFCLIIVIESILKKKYIDILKYITGFIFGILLIFIPIYIYLRTNNAVGDFYNYVILGGVTRGFRSTLKDSVKLFYLVINRNYSFIPLCVGLIWLITKYKNINTFYFYGYISSYLLSIIFLSFSFGNSHYNLILIPFFVPAITYLSESLLGLFSKVKYKYLALVLFFCVAFSEGIIRFSYYLLFDLDSNNPHKIAGKIIDENTSPDDKIINLGWNGHIYPYSKRDFASRYIYQAEAFDHIPGSQEEFISTIKNNNPKIITIYTESGGIEQYKPLWHKDIYDLLETNYKIIDDTHGFKILLRNN